MKSLADDALMNAASSVITSSDFLSPRNVPERKYASNSTELLVRKDSASTLELEVIVKQQPPSLNDENNNSTNTLRHEEREKIKNDRTTTGVVEHILDSFSILCNAEVDASRGFCRATDQGLGSRANDTTITNRKQKSQSRDDADCTTSDEYLTLIDQCQVPRSQMSNLSSDALNSAEIN